MAVLGFFLPIHFLAATRHRCCQCGTAYTAGPGCSAVLLNSMFGLAVFLMGKAWPLSLVWLVVWVPVALKLRKEGREAGMAHTLVAGLFLGALWSFALMVGVPWVATLTDRFVSFLTFFMVVFMGGVAISLFALHLDVRFPPRLVVK